MKINYLITIFTILLVTLTACATIETNVVDELPEETEETEVVVISEGESSEGSVVEESGSSEDNSNEKNVSVLIQQAYEDAGLIDNSTETEEEEETTTETVKDINIEYFKGPLAPLIFPFIEGKFEIYFERFLNGLKTKAEKQ